MNFLTEITIKTLNASHDIALTEREYQVLLCISWGLSNKEVANTLSISHRTVEIHRSNLLRKLNAKNAPDAVRIAISLGIKMDQAPCKAELKA